MANRTPLTVLIVDDENQVRRFLRAGFELEGYQVHEAVTGGEGIKTATLRALDLVVVDLELPDMDGSDVIERIRSWSQVPVIVLSVRATEDEKVRLLELGADDFVVKPFGMAELLARAKAALRRYERSTGAQSVVSVGRLTVDLARRATRVGGVEIQLTPKEFRLLQVLAQSQGKVVTQQHLLREVWGPAHIEDAHYLRILVRKLRQKIEPDPTRPSHVLTDLGVGYRLRQGGE